MLPLLNKYRGLLIVLFIISCKSESTSERNRQNHPEQSIQGEDTTGVFESENKQVTIIAEKTAKPGSFLINYPVDSLFA